MSALRWGVIGASSRIYRGRLLPPMETSDRHTVVAEASRDASGSDAPYGDVLRDPNVDAVYIPLPNDGHKPWILRCLEAGKHVLCEKPLTLSAADTAEVYDAAAAAGRVLVEAYMWPHHPRHQLVLQLARTELGALRFSTGSFMFPLRKLDDHRLDARGAGALFDVGIYCLGPAVLLATREPVAVAASAVRNGAGVDVSLSGWLDLGDGFTATASVSFDAAEQRSLEIIGTAGSIRILTESAPGPAEPSTLTVRLPDGSGIDHEVAGADAYGQMIDQFADVVEHGAQPAWSSTHSITLARWIDALHAASI